MMCNLKEGHQHILINKYMNTNKAPVTDVHVALELLKFNQIWYLAFCPGNR